MQLSEALGAALLSCLMTDVSNCGLICESVCRTINSSMQAEANGKRSERDVACRCAPAMAVVVSFFPSVRMRFFC
jgi:hypothetical protein